MVLYASTWCVYAFLLHWESLDIIFGPRDEPLISDVVLSHLHHRSVDRARCAFPGVSPPRCPSGFCKLAWSTINSLGSPHHANLQLNPSGFWKLLPPFFLYCRHWLFWLHLTVHLIKKIKNYYIFCYDLFCYYIKFKHNL
jgi:hypothetical protein